MAKAQVKKKATPTAKKPLKKKVAERLKRAVKAVKKIATRAVAGKKKPAKPAPKTKVKVKVAKPAKKSVKKAAPKKGRPAPKTKVKVKVAKKAAAKKPALKPAPKKAAKALKGAKKVVAKATKPLKKVAKPVAKAVAKAAPKAAPAKKAVAPAPKSVPPPAPAKVKAKAIAVAPLATPAAPKAAPAAEKRARRPRPRILSNGTPVAAWLTPGEKPRPSSFIPAPARAEAPSLIAAPPASSDRLIRPEDVSDLAVRTVPIRVDIEQGGGRTFLGVSPEEVTLKPGEGIEWDFRYVGGADVMADEIVIEFEKPAPFAQHIFKSRKPGTARPHRQLSGPAEKSAAGKRVRYVIRAMTPFKTEYAVSRPWVTVQE